mmetsp:Transcript_35296/g.76141  ORF Transcript_35296/g.76141 Transcript_35296/m.76141 type:complete len:115 (+) Transcript_35296:107-451(+)
MTNSSLFKAAVILVLSVFILLPQDLGTPDFFLKDDSEVLVHSITNMGGHVYPYTATIITLTFLITMSELHNLTQTHEHTHTHSLSLSLSLARAHKHTLTQTLTQTHFHTLTLSH